MKNKQNDLLKFAPMENYNAPELPTLEEGTPEILKKMPLRWKSKVMAAAVAGFLGTTTLAGCGVVEEVITPITDDYQYHYGGAGEAPMYVVHLTEQEALGIIKSQLEAAGLNFDEPSQPYHVQINWTDAEIVLANEEKDLKIALVNRWWEWLDSEAERLEFVEYAREQFSEDFGIYVDAFFFNSADELWSYDGSEELRAEFEEDLTRQVQDFIQQLRDEDIIE